jgi:hypothetical protein
VSYFGRSDQLETEDWKFTFTAVMPARHSTSCYIDVQPNSNPFRVTARSTGMRMWITRFGHDTVRVHFIYQGGRFYARRTRIIEVKYFFGSSNSTPTPTAMATGSPGGSPTIAPTMTPTLTPTASATGTVGHTPTPSEEMGEPPFYYTRVTGPYYYCAYYNDQLHARERDVRRCTMNAECDSQIRWGCGCQHDIPVNGNADPNAFYQTAYNAQQSGCTLNNVSSCDCMPNMQMMCVEGYCTWEQT